MAHIHGLVVQKFNLNSIPTINYTYYATTNVLQRNNILNGQAKVIVSSGLGWSGFTALAHQCTGGYYVVYLPIVCWVCNIIKHSVLAHALCSRPFTISNLSRLLLWSVDEEKKQQQQPAEVSATLINRTLCWSEELSKMVRCSI